MSENLPKAVQAGLEKADAIQTKMNDGNRPKPTPVPAPEQQAPKAEPPKVVDPEATMPPPASEETWEQRYKSFKGTGDRLLEDNKRLHAENNRLAEDSRTMREELSALRRQVEDMSKAPPEPEPEPPQGATEEDVESFGSDMVGFVTRVSQKAAADAMSVVNAKFAGIMATLEEMRGEVSSVDQRSTQSATALFFKDLKTAVPDYAEINETVEWKEWLQITDPMAGVSRQVLLSDAQAKMDVDRVAAIFEAYKAQAQGNVEVTTEPSPQQQALESQVSPPKSKTQEAGGSRSDKQAKVWTQAEISDFYSRAARGLVNAEEFAATEMEINRAVATSRVR